MCLGRTVPKMYQFRWKMLELGMLILAILARSESSMGLATLSKKGSFQMAVVTLAHFR